MGRVHGRRLSLRRSHGDLEEARPCLQERSPHPEVLAWHWFLPRRARRRPRASRSASSPADQAPTSRLEAGGLRAQGVSAAEIRLWFAAIRASLRRPPPRARSRTTKCARSRTRVPPRISTRLPANLIECVARLSAATVLIGRRPAGGSGRCCGRRDARHVDPDARAHRAGDGQRLEVLALHARGPRTVDRVDERREVLGDRLGAQALLPTDT